MPFFLLLRPVSGRLTLWVQILSSRDSRPRMAESRLTGHKHGLDDDDADRPQRAGKSLLPRSPRKGKTLPQGWRGGKRSINFRISYSSDDDDDEASDDAARGDRSSGDGYGTGDDSDSDDPTEPVFRGRAPPFVKGRRPRAAVAARSFLPRYPCDCVVRVGPLPTELVLEPEFCRSTVTRTAPGAEDATPYNTFGGKDPAIRGLLATTLQSELGGITGVGEALNVTPAIAKRILSWATHAHPRMRGEQRLREEMSRWMPRDEDAQWVIVGRARVARDVPSRFAIPVPLWGRYAQVCGCKWHCFSIFDPYARSPRLLTVYLREMPPVQYCRCPDPGPCMFVEPRGHLRIARGFDARAALECLAGMSRVRAHWTPGPVLDVSGHRVSYLDFVATAKWFLEDSGMFH